ncbi:MAG: hypothetical protein ACXWED_05175 [Solirubrobacterales bacterium]
MRIKTTKTGRILGLSAAMLLVGALMVGLTSSAAAGGDSSATVAKKKKKKCPAGTTKQVVRKKGKKKIKCVPVAATTPTPTPAATAKLSITPTSFDFGGVNQGGLDNCQPPPDADCPTQDFTVSNAGPNASGALAASIVGITVPPGIPGFEVFANTCTAPLAPGASCTVTVRFGDDNNSTYVSRLDVTASPGGTASATVMGS